MYLGESLSTFFILLGERKDIFFKLIKNQLPFGSWLVIYGRAGICTLHNRLFHHL